MAQSFMSPALACGLLGTIENKGKIQTPRHGSGAGCPPTLGQIAVCHSRNVMTYPRLARIRLQNTA